jgi:glycosyltransferase involved in cell wall biosynthesis
MTAPVMVPLVGPLLGEPCADMPLRVPLDPSERIRVVEVLATGSNGGAQENVRGLVSRLDRGRFDVEIVSLSDGNSVRRLRAAGERVTVIDAPDDEASVRDLAALLRSYEPHVVHNHMYRAEIVGTRAALALAGFGLPRPYVISTIHSSRVRSAADRALVRRLTPDMDRLVAVSRAIVAKLEREGRDMPGGPPIELVYNGVDLSVYDRTEACCTLPEEYGFDPGSPLVGCVARLEPEKGQATLLEAWPQVLQRVPEARLLIVGEGSQREALEAQARELGILGGDCDGAACVGTRGARPGAMVVFTGRRDDVPSVTAALDVAVLPSYREALGLVVLEAMALSRPVVASAVGGIPEMIDDGRTGLLVPPREPAALASAISRLLLDHPFADMIARAGHDEANARFCIQLMVREIERLYEEGAAVVAARPQAVTGAA